MSKLISVYNEEERAGSTTIAITLAVLFSWYADKKTLLINFAKDDKMEQYITDVKIRYGLDYLRALQDDLKEIKIFTTQLNDNLSVIGCGTQESNDNSFIDKIITKASVEYEIIIIDLSNSDEKNIKSRATRAITVKNFDIRKLESEYEENEVPLFNKIPGEIKEIVSEVINSKVEESKIVTFDIDVWQQITMRDSIYSFLVENVNNNVTFIQEQLQIVEQILGEKLSSPAQQGLLKNIIHKFRKEGKNEF